MIKIDTKYSWLLIFLTSLSYNIYAADQTEWVQKKALLGGNENTDKTYQPIPWKIEAELGLVITQGNTETQTINSKLDLTKEQKNWRYNLHFEALNTSSDEITSAEKYLGSGKINYKFKQKDYLFGLLIYEVDRFSGFKDQTTGSLGYGHSFISSKKKNLDIEAGFGYRQNTLDTGSSESEGIFSLAGVFKWKVSKTTDFKQSLNTHIGENITISKSDTSLQVNIKNNLAMKLSYNVKHSSDVPLNTKKTDSITSVTLVYTF
ncbi:MAG: DUF481 domain-containing protein [Methylococcales bacterium]|jgi:putative salt-induced outer membrane protein|nr:DUF481 domain-containing protein [Methylococcales bacterium]MBT7408299.1 DUF481 domain-containing protein [Methylococcales bacterium]